MPAADKRVLGDAGGGNSKKPIILGAICVIVVIALCVGVGIQQLKPQRVLTINKEKFTMDDMMYPIYERESTYLPMEEMYQYYMGTSVWDAAYQGEDTSIASGTPNSSALKQEIINKETEYGILYNEAVNAKYELTEDEKKDAEKQAEDALKGLSGVQKLKLCISKKTLFQDLRKEYLLTGIKKTRRKF